MDANPAMRLLTEGRLEGRARVVVIAGLDPAIHLLRKMLLAKIDGYAGQARA